MLFIVAYVIGVYLLAVGVFRMVWLGWFSYLFGCLFEFVFGFVGGFVFVIYCNLLFDFVVAVIC